MKRFLLVIFLFFISINGVKAYTDKTNSINIDIYIDKYGNAAVQEVWDTEVASGTENYKQMLDLQDSVVNNFKVVDETNKVYSNVDNWNSNSSLTEKQFKSGIKKINNGIELCWGVSGYGHKIYTLSYNISNFVQQYNDAQGIYFTLINRSDLPPQQVKVVITSDYSFTLNNTFLWAYGYVGKDNVTNNNLVFEGSNFTSSNHLTILVKFNENLFLTSSKINGSFNDVLATAEKGVTTPNSFYLNRWEIIILVITIIIGIITRTGVDDISVLIILVAAVLLKVYNTYICFLIYYLYLIFSRHMVPKPNLDSYIKNIVMINGTIIMPEDEYYYRDIPFDGDINQIMVTAINFNIIKNPNGLIGAYFLKWLENDQIRIIVDEKGRPQIDLNKLTSIDTKEKKIIDILKQSVGINGLLDINDLKKWSKKNYISYNEILHTALHDGADHLFQKGQLAVNNLVGSAYDYSYFNTTRELNNDAINLNGLKNYLLNFSNIETKVPAEIVILSKYLIVAQALGIADKVAEQFKKLYPDFETTIKLELKHLNYIARMSSISYISYRHSYQNENRRFTSSNRRSSGSSDRSRGSGGFSSFGGGSGARGGSSTSISGRR